MPAGVDGDREDREQGDDDDEVEEDDEGGLRPQAARGADDYRDHGEVRKRCREVGERDSRSQCKRGAVSERLLGCDLMGDAVAQGPKQADERECRQAEAELDHVLGVLSHIGDSGEDRLTGDRLEYDTRTGTGVVHRAQAFSAPYYRLSGEQIERIGAAGISLTHLDAHKHVHAYPPIFRVVTRLAQRFGIETVRVPFERRTAAVGGTLRARVAGWRQAAQNLALARWAAADRRAAAAAGLRTPAFIGRVHTGVLDGAALEAMLRRVGPGTSACKAPR